MGDLVLTAQRLLLMAFVIPCSARFFSRRLGGFAWVDFLMLAHVGWCYTSIFINQGTDAGIKTGGMYIIEAWGSYVFGRAYVRNVQEFRRFSALMTVAVMLLMLFTVPESLSNYPVIRGTVAQITHQKMPNPVTPRHGLARAYGPFEHPILYGMFCALAFGLSWYGLPETRILGLKRVGRTVVITVATVASVSSGALLSLGIQFGLVIWEKLTHGVRHRWMALSGLALLAIISISIISNRDIVSVLLTYGSFDPWTAFWRKLEWQYAGAEALRHPLFGIGLREWSRPEWMYSASIDAFWLATAVKYGIVASSLLFAAVLLLVSNVFASDRGGADAVISCRRAFLLAIVGTSVSGFTVHFWGAPFNLFCLLLGAGVWLTKPQTHRRVE